ncbi:hypothetical protein PTKIN_Ptkin17bG0025200 [Pterospermum kingtungense]
MASFSFNSGQVLRVTIWAELIQEIKPNELSKMHNPIIIFAGTTVKSYNEELYLASCIATKTYINLDISETRRLKQVHENERIQLQMLPLDDENQHGTTNIVEIKPTTIEELLNFNPKTIQNVRFSCQARVIDVDPFTGWFYNTCNQCYKSLRLHDQSFHCANHGEKASMPT